MESSNLRDFVRAWSYLDDDEVDNNKHLDSYSSSSTQKYHKADSDSTAEINSITNVPNDENKTQIRRRTKTEKTRKLTMDADIDVFSTSSLSSATHTHIPTKAPSFIDTVLQPVYFVTNIFSIENYTEKAKSHPISHLSQGLLLNRDESNKSTLQKPSATKLTSFTSPYSTSTSNPSSSKITKIINPSGTHQNTFPSHIELQLFVTVMIREFVFSFIHAFLNKSLGIFAKYFLVELILSGEIPILKSIQNYLQFGPTTIYFFLFTVFSYLFAAAKTGAIVNPAVGAGLVGSNNLRMRHYIIVTCVHIVSNFYAMKTLSLIVSKEYQNSFDPPMFPSTIYPLFALSIELVQAYIFTFWISITANLTSWSYERRTMSNVLVRQICYVLGYNFSRSCGNPGLALGSSLFVWNQGWRDAKLLLPFCLTYTFGPCIGSYLGAINYQFLKTKLQNNRKTLKILKNDLEPINVDSTSVKNAVIPVEHENDKDIDYGYDLKKTDSQNWAMRLKKLTLESIGNSLKNDELQKLSPAPAPRTSLNFMSAFPVPKKIEKGRINKRKHDALSRLTMKQTLQQDNLFTKLMVSCSIIINWVSFGYFLLDSENNQSKSQAEHTVVKSSKQTKRKNKNLKKK